MHSDKGLKTELYLLKMSQYVLFNVSRDSKFVKIMIHSHIELKYGLLLRLIGY